MTQKQPSSEAISRGCSSYSSRFCFGGVRSRVDGARTPGRTGVSMELLRQEELAFVGGSKKFDFWLMDLVLVRGLRSCFLLTGRDRGVPWTCRSCVELWISYVG